MDEPILMGLEEACEEGERIEFRFRSGPECQGWVEEIAADAIRVSWAPSPFYAQSTGTREDAPPPEWVRLVDIVPSSLAAWD